LLLCHRKNRDYVTITQFIQVLITGFYDEPMSQQLLLEIIPAANPTIEHTVVGQNAPAIAAVKTLSAGRALYLWGPEGSGKTHLLKACAAMQSCRYVDQNTPEAEIGELATAAAEQAFPQVIAVDDVGRLSEAQRACVFALYNRWRELATTQSAFALIVSGERAPLMMDLREDLRSRLGWDLVFRLETLSDEDKYQALVSHASLIGLPLSSDVLQWMFTHYTRDIRQLFALVDALDRYSLSKHRTITVPLIRTMLSDSGFLQS
jgi:DnaA family protein